MTDQAQIDEPVIAAARTLFPSAGEPAPVGDLGDVARVEAGGQAVLVRRWPGGASGERIQWVHDALRMAREGGLDIVPEPVPGEAGRFTVNREGVLFDAVAEGAGRTLVGPPTLADRNGWPVHRPLALPRGSVGPTAEAIAGFHDLTRPAIIERSPRMSLRAWASAIDRATADARGLLHRVAGNQSQVKGWSMFGGILLPAAMQSLEEVDFLDGERPVIAHLDLWPDQVAFAGRTGAPVGIQGFQQAACSSPLIDLSSLLIHFGGWTADGAEEVLGSASGVLHLSPQERRAFAAVSALDAVAECGRMLVGVYAARGGMPPGAERLREGIAGLIGTLETLERARQRQVNPPGQARAWVHRGPGGKPLTPGAGGSRPPRPKAGSPRRPGR